MEASDTSGGLPSASWGSVTAWAERARKKASETAQATYEKVNETASTDVELGETAGQWATWAKSAAGQYADQASKGLAQAAEKAKTGQSAFGSQVAQTMGKVGENAAKAGSGLTDSAKAAQQKAASAAGSMKGGISGVGSGIMEKAGGFKDSMSVMSPTKLAQFGGLFFLGMLLISLSISFLPLLPIAPQKFALLFAMGSLTMLASVAWLKGPSSFAKVVVQREKLPFSVSYGVGLIGTFWATLVARSYLFTAVFALMQAFGLLYFLASFIPGGQAILNGCGRVLKGAASMCLGQIRGG